MFAVKSENEAAQASQAYCVSSQINEVLAHLLSVSPTLVPEVFAA
jgi:hypothetical protein